MAESVVYVCDLDGTLLRSDGTLSEFSRNGLNRLLENGVSLTVASARGTPGMRSLLAGVAIRLPVIELNGAFVSEIESGHHLVSTFLADGEACAAVEAILETDNDPVVSTWDGGRDGVHFGTRTNDSTRWYIEEKRKYRDPRLAPCDDLLGIVRGANVAQITTFALDEDAARLVEQLRHVLGEAASVPLDVRGRRPQHCSGKRPSRGVGKRHGGRALERRRWSRPPPAGPPFPFVSLEGPPIGSFSAMRGRSR